MASRSNRERGVKLLRCFPHCCPEHVQRCYCGTSIHVLVTFAAVVPVVSQRNLVVCARFEPSRVVPLSPNLVNPSNREGIDDDNQRKLQPGEVISLPESLLLAEMCGIQQTVWIRADREGDTKQKYEVRHSYAVFILWLLIGRVLIGGHCLDNVVRHIALNMTNNVNGWNGYLSYIVTPKDAVLFVLNNHRFPKWFYSYDSSITRSQREMTHHLVVYVFRLTGKSSKLSGMDAIVLARHESPGFLLVSFRRSGNNSRDAGCDLPAIDVANSNKFAAVEIDSPDVCSLPSDDLKIDLVDRSVFKPSFQKMNANRLDASQGQPRFSHTHKRFKHEEKQHQQVQAKAGGNSVSPFEATSDTFSWQQGTRARNCRFQEKGQHLLILWSFLQSFSLSDLKITTKSTSEHICSHWLRVAAILQSPSPSSSRQLQAVVISFLSGIFKHAFGQPGISSRPPFATESDILQVIALLFVRTLSSRSAQRILHSACSFSNAETSKAELQIRFVLLTSDLYDTIGGELREVSTQTAGLEQGQQCPSLPALVDDVLSLVYGRPRFRQLRSRVSALLLGEQASLFEALNGVFQVFTALVRERMIASAIRYRRYTRFQYFVPRHNLPERWNQCWLLEPRSMNLVDVSRGGCGHDMRLVDFVQLLSEFGCVDVTIRDDVSSMSLRSAVSFLDNTAVSPMTLVLDGKLRLFRVLPSGVSSMIMTAGRWSIGDYTATFLADENSLKVNFFCFAEEKTGEVSPRPVDSRGLESNIYADLTRLRRVCISIRLEEKSHNDRVNPMDLYAVVRGTSYESIYSSPSQEVDRFKFSERTVLERAVIWSEVEWKPLLKIRAECVPLSRVGFIFGSSGNR